MSRAVHGCIKLIRMPCLQARVGGFWVASLVLATLLARRCCSVPNVSEGGVQGAVAVAHSELLLF